MLMEKKQYTYDYPHPAVTTDCVIFGYDSKEGLSVLLVQRGGEPYKGSWAFPGGFMRIDEDAETGARRELKEETSFEVSSIEQFGFSTLIRLTKWLLSSVSSQSQFLPSVLCGNMVRRRK